MNFLLLIILAVFVADMYLGYRRGFVKVILLLGSWIFSMLISSFLSPHVGDFLEHHTGMYQKMSTAISEDLKKSTEEQVEEDLDGQVRLPKNLLRTLEGFTNEDTAEMLDDMGVYRAMGEKLAHILINALSYIITLLLAMIIFRVLLHMTDVINNIPIVGGINKIAGLAVGFLQALLVSWVICMLISLTADSTLGGHLYHSVESSRILRLLYHHNFLYTIVMKII